MISLLLMFVFLNFAPTPQSQSIVRTLPGYNGTLPFRLETGYVNVSENVELFYYFIESERHPVRDPLLLWLTGGLGCSGLSALVYEIGPLKFDYKSFDGSLPSLLLNPYSWTKIANIIFLDWPAGTGFSYATAPEGYNTSDTKTSEDIYTFLQQWLLMHPNFIKNRLYIGGESYGGKQVPMIAYKVAQGIEEGLEPRMQFQGYVIGNPETDLRIDRNARVPFVNRLAILSDEYYQLLSDFCHGEYTNPDPTNVWCLYALQFYEECIRNVYRANVLEPACKFRSPDEVNGTETYSEEEDSLITLPQSTRNQFWCRNNHYAVSYVWANDVAVQDALHTRNGTIEQWRRCNGSLSYDRDVESVVHYHQILLERGYELLVYSGDHDMEVPYIGTLEWMRLLNLTVDQNWRPWLVDAQVAGYTERYTYRRPPSHLTFATVKGAGHTAPEYKPRQCFAMLERFFETYPL